MGNSVAVLHHKFKRPAHFGLTSIWKNGENLIPQTSTKLWIRHVYSAFCAMRRSPLTSILTLLTISIVFSLIGAFLFVVENLNATITRSSLKVSVSIYLKDGENEQDRSVLRKHLSEFPDVETVSFTSKEDALRTFRESLGSEQDVLDGLEGQNPLPASFEVQFKTDPQAGFHRLEQSLQKNEIVSQVQFNESLARQFASLAETIRSRGRYIVIVILALAAFIIANTLTLSLHAHRDEIEVMKLVGADRSFIRGPYVVEGMVQGLVGGGLGIMVVYGLYRALRGLHLEAPIMEILFSQMSFLSVFSILALLAAGLVVGFIGSFISVARYEGRY